MQSEQMKPGIKPGAPATPARGNRRTIWGVMAIILLVGYTTGFFTRPILTPTGSFDDEVSLPLEVVKDMPLAQAYQLLERQVAELSRQAAGRRSPGLEQSVQMLAQEVRELRTLNPYFRFQEIKAATMPTGVPPVYGDTLQVSFDQVQASMDILSRLDPTYGADKIVLSGLDLERYIQIGQQTACRYCCNARTLTFPNGDAACGCQHSQAMRGLAAYLITTQSQRYSDEEIVAELNQWRAIFFPKQTLIATLLAMKQAGEPGIEEIEAEFPEFLPSMVGDC